MYSLQNIHPPKASGIIHRMPVSVKMATTVLLLAAIVAVPFSHQMFFVGVGLCLTAAAVASRIPLLSLIRRLLVLEVFVIGVVLLSLFQPGGRDVFARIFVKSTLCLLTVVLFSGTTNITDLLGTLRRWGAPDLMVTVLSLMYRYVFVMADETVRMQRARSSRSFGGSRWTRWKLLATLIAQLFVRSTERAERIYSAMCARGWK